ncbi:MAG: DUF1232 domain-containing protein [Chloroflexi bacterium]|nr:DUF1232 domain-containing protein [Chloroflexota bacterium]
MARRKTEDSRGKGGGSRSRSRGGAARRLLGLLAFLPVASRAPLYARLVFALVVDDRVPNSRKAMLAGALGYVAFGRDIVPDDIPVLGGLDDLVVIAVALDVFLDGVDDDVLEEKLAELGIDRGAFDDDVARIRRFLPGPIRRTVRRLPGLLGAAGEALQQSGLGPRLRAWITREDSIA